jgi:hypothetical protein
MARISIELAEPAATFAAHFPRTGIVVRDIPSGRQRAWRLVQLDEKFDHRAKANEWLLVRAGETPEPGAQPAPVDVLLVGGAPQVRTASMKTALRASARR